MVSVPGSTRQHCRFVDPTDSDGCFKSVGSWLKPIVLSKPTLSACVSSWQCWASYHCRFTAQVGYVSRAITVDWWLKPTVLSSATLPVWISIRQWWLNQHCRLMPWTGSALFTISTGFMLTDSDFFFAFYCFIIYFILFYFFGGIRFQFIFAT